MAANLLPIVAIAAVGGLLLAAKKSKAATLPPGPVIPLDVVGQPTRRTLEGPSGSSYAVDTWPPDANDVVFTIARLVKFNGPVSLEPYSSWVAYYQQRSTGQRTFADLHVPGEGPGPNAIADVMLRDWGLSSQDPRKAA